jgi:cytidine deaminase
VFTDASLRELLPQWPDDSRAELGRALAPANGGRIDAASVSRLGAARGSIDTLMTELLPIARRYAKPPLSNFFVGAIALGKSGALFVGANLEVPHAALNQAIHAEQSAVANAYGHGESGITAIAVTAAPCGHCRQFLTEIAGGEDIRILIPGDRPRPVKSLLPMSFGPRDLGKADAMFVSAPVALQLAGGGDALAERALEAAMRAYAPYSDSPSGCAIEMKSGTIVSGSYLENVAFNPSLAPLQSALVAVVMHQEELADITRVVLVEVNDARITHSTGTQMVLAELAPHATLAIAVANRV